MPFAPYGQGKRCCVLVMAFKAVKHPCKKSKSLNRAAEEQVWRYPDRLTYIPVFCSSCQETLEQGSRRNLHQVLVIALPNAELLGLKIILWRTLGQTAMPFKCIMSVMGLASPRKSLNSLLAYCQSLYYIQEDREELQH